MRDLVGHDVAKQYGGVLFIATVPLRSIHKQMKQRKTLRRKTLQPPQWAFIGE
jgi:hypothetical protein